MREKSRRFVVNREKIWNLAYVDDIVLIAKGTNNLKEMLTSFLKFWKKREVILSIEKSKVMT